MLTVDHNPMSDHQFSLTEDHFLPGGDLAVPDQTYVQPKSSLVTEKVHCKFRDALVHFRMKYFTVHWDTRRLEAEYLGNVCIVVQRWPRNSTADLSPALAIDQLLCGTSCWVQALFLYLQSERQLFQFHKVLGTRRSFRKALKRIWSVF